jgi:glycyl-tRNA synthetase
MQGDLDAGKAVSFKVSDALMVQIEPGMVEIKQERKKVAGRAFTPSVIEPSFGIGRIIYCMFEHTFYNRWEHLADMVRRGQAVRGVI